MAGLTQDMSGEGGEVGVVVRVVDFDNELEHIEESGDVSFGGDDGEL